MGAERDLMIESQALILMKPRRFMVRQPPALIFDDRITKSDQERDLSKNNPATPYPATARATGWLLIWRP